MNSPAVPSSTGRRGRTPERSGERLRILRVAQSVYPEVVGGIGIHVDDMSRRQAEMGHEVTVLTSDNGRRELPGEVSRGGYRLRRHRELANPVHNSITPGIVRSLRRNLPDHDVLHLHSHMYFMSNVAAAMAHTADVPVVLTNHGVNSNTAPSWLMGAFNRTIGRLTWETADTVLCYTDTDRERLRRRHVTTDIRVVPNGIDTETFAPDPSIERQPTLLSVGRLRRNKGMDDLIRAFARIAPELPGYSLEIVGNGPQRGALERLARRTGVGGRVRFAGELPNERLPRRYNRSELFVLPSLSEGLPRTVLEAMACATPVVVSDLDQLQDVVDGAGRTVPTRSPDRLADQLRTLVSDDRTRSRLGRVGRSRVTTAFSWERTVRETTRAYHDAIEGS